MSTRLSGIYVSKVTRPGNNSPFNCLETLTVANPSEPLLVGALCFSRGEQRLSVAEKGWTSIMRFGAGLENPGLKPALSE
jgi:hypothetical protein